MKSQSILAVVTLAKLGTLETIRSVDFEAIAAKNPDGRLSPEEIMNGGDFSVRFTGKGRETTPVEFPASSAAAADAFVRGFSAMADLKTAKAPKKTIDFDAETFAKTMKRADVGALKKPELMLLAKHVGATDVKPNMKKGEIADMIVAKAKLKS